MGNWLFSSASRLSSIRSGPLRRFALGGVGLLLASTIRPLPLAEASSHREAPFITERPKVDATDLYLFSSYETGRADYVTVIANYLPLQDPYGGPNYFSMDPDAAYDIHFDNDGDAREDLTFRFRFRQRSADLTVPVNGVPMQVPLIAIGAVTGAGGATQNVSESYSISLLKEGRSKGKKLTHQGSGATHFDKPLDNIGNKTIADYGAYSSQFVYPVNVPGCSQPGRVFVGQRKDPFVVNLGETFDLVNLSNPLGAPNGESDDLADKNVTAFALEIHKSCLLAEGRTVIGAWTTSSLPEESELRRNPGSKGPERTSGRLVQVSRLGNPLVNELVIGLKDKDRFNGSAPSDDAQFALYVTNPTLPALLEILFGAAGVRAPTQFPRADLVQVFLTGVDGLNSFGAGAKAAEMMRLNTATPPVAKGAQNNLAVIGGDTAGYPNGRRPGDDVVDISLRVVMGKLLPEGTALSGQLPFTDGAAVSAANFGDAFPYLTSPIPGSPSTARPAV